MRHVLHHEHVSTAEEIYGRLRRAAPTPRNRLLLAILYRVARTLALARPLRRLVPRLEAGLEDVSAFKALLRKLVPKLVVVSSTGTFGSDTQILRATRTLRIPVTTVILSWDNTSSTGYPAAFGDYVVAWTDTMKQELVRLLDYRPEQVVVRGVAHFDLYHRADPGYDRVAVIRALGLDPDRRTIVFATKSPNSYLCNALVAEHLAAAIRDETLSNSQLVIRVHPIHYRRDRTGKLTYAPVLDAYRAIAQKYPHVVVSEPLLAGESRGHIMVDAEMLELTRLMRAGDVLVNMFSTMNIEGALLNKPLVNVCFELTEVAPDWTRHPERYDIRSDAAEHHNMRIIDSGATRIAYSPRELVEHVSAYLADPSLDGAARRVIAGREGGPFGGSAGNAIADYIIHSAQPAGARFS
jgi:hypothetical protein